MKTEEKKSTFLFYRRRLRFEIFRRDFYRCQFCGRGIVDGIELTLDHVVPKSKGGPYTKENLITACRDCNEGKWDDALNGFELRRLKDLCEALRPRPSIIVIAR